MHSTCSSSQSSSISRFTHRTTGASTARHRHVVRVRPLKLWTAAALQIAGRSIMAWACLPALSATVARTAASRSSLSRLTSHQQQDTIQAKRTRSRRNISPRPAGRRDATACQCTACVCGRLLRGRRRPPPVAALSLSCPPAINGSRAALSTAWWAVARAAGPAGAETVEFGEAEGGRAWQWHA